MQPYPPYIDRPRRPSNVPVPQGLREAFEAQYLRAYHAAPDPRKFRAADVIQPFLKEHGEQVSQSRLYVWLDVLRASGALDCCSSQRLTPAFHRQRDTERLAEGGNNLQAEDSPQASPVPHRTVKHSAAFAVADHLAECIRDPG